MSEKHYSFGVKYQIITNIKISVLTEDIRFSHVEERL